MRWSVLILCSPVALLAFALTARAHGGDTPARQEPGTGGTTALPGTPPPGPLDGPGLFRERGCAQCHQIDGAGGHKGPDLSGVGRRLKRGAIEQQIVKGGAAMPAFGDALPAEEIATLTKFLARLRKKTPARPAAGRGFAGRDRRILVRVSMGRLNSQLPISSLWCDVAQKVIDNRCAAKLT